MMIQHIHILVAGSADGIEMPGYREKQPKGEIPRYVFQTAGSSEAAFVELENRRPDVIICTEDLSGASPLTFLHRLHFLSDPPPVICVGGGIGEEAVAELFKAGAADFVGKGRAEQLETAVGDCLRKRIGAAHFQQAITRYRTLFENAEDGFSIYAYSPDHKTPQLIDCNAQYAKMAGRTRKDLFSGNVRKYQKNEMPREKVHNNYRRLEMRESYEGLFSWKRPDGRVNYVEYRAVPVRTGDTTLTFGVDRDVTRRVLTEQTLRTDLGFAEILLGAFPDAVAITDLTGRIRLANPLSASMRGYADIKQMTNRSPILFDHFAARDRSRLQSECKATLSGKSFRHRRFSALKQDGSTLPVDTSVTPLTSTTDRPDGYLIVSHSTTEPGSESALFQNYRRQLIRAETEAATTHMVGGLAHEINNPNHIIRLNLSILKRICESALPLMQAAAKESPPVAGGITPDAIREQFDKVYHNLVSASERIRNILSHVSRLSPNASSNGHRRFDIDEAVSVSIHMLEEQIQSATDRFSHHPAGNIPPAIGNPRHFRQALINLLLNACQALEHAEQAVIVRTFALPATSGAVIEIRDEGRGIPPEILSQVRFPFFTTRRSQKALGMGLSIAERIISDMGGLLQIDSVAGEGTLVSVQLPTAPTGDIEEDGND